METSLSGREAKTKREASEGNGVKFKLVRSRLKGPVQRKVRREEPIQEYSIRQRAGKNII